MLTRTSSKSIGKRSSKKHDTSGKSFYLPPSITELTPYKTRLADFYGIASQNKDEWTQISNKCGLTMSVQAEGFLDYLESYGNIMISIFCYIDKQFLRMMSKKLELYF